MDDVRVSEQAAQWFGTLLDGNEQRAAFFAWLAESPRHVEEFLCVLACAQELAELTPERRQRIEQVSRELGSAKATDVLNVIPMSARALESCERVVLADSVGTPAPAATSSDRKRNIRRHVVSALAASAVLGLTATWWFTGPGSWTRYSTEVGERREIKLADGSKLHLNTDTEVAVRLTGNARTVQLVRGEALFSVASDTARPFRVRAADTMIQAIGTQFDVYRKRSGTRVAVIEGLVQISAVQEPATPGFPLIPKGSVALPGSGSGSSSGSAAKSAGPAHTNPQLLGAGQEAEMSPQGTLSRRDKGDALKDISWRQGRIVFEDDTLGEIASEFNRYNPVVKINVVGDIATKEHFSGTFDADAPEAIMQALAGDPTLRVELIGNVIRIEGR